MSFEPAGIRWPANHRAALAIVIPVPDLELAGASSDGSEYTAEGLRRLLSALADLDVIATFAVTNTQTLLGKRLVEELSAAGHEVVEDRSATQSATMIGEDGQWPDSHGVVTGWPGAATVADATIPANWVIDGRTGDAPSLIEGSLVKSVHVPTSTYWNDASWLSPEHPLPPSSLLEHWSVSLADIRADGLLMTVVLHPHIAGRPGILSQVLRFLDEAVDSGDVWMSSVGNIAAWWKQDRT